MSRYASLFATEKVWANKNPVYAEPFLYEDSHLSGALPVAGFQHPDHLTGDAQFLG